MQSVLGAVSDQVADLVFGLWVIDRDPVAIALGTDVMKQRLLREC